MKPVSLKDLARELSVSMGTVSSVLNGKAAERRISEATQARIRDAAREMGYLSDIAAQRIRDPMRRTRQLVIALFTSYEAPLEWVGWLARGIESEFAESRFSTLKLTVNVELFHAGKLAENDLICSGGPCHGAILTNTAEADDLFLRHNPLAFPAVLFDRCIEGYTSVLIDTEQAAYDVANLLCAHQRNMPAVFKPQLMTAAVKKRFEAFCLRAEELTGCSAIQIPVRHLNEQSACSALQQYFKAGGTMDSLFALSDTFAIGAYKAIKESGRKIPDDVMVIGFDGITTAPYMDPPLTTFQTRSPEIQRAPAKLLLRQIFAVADQPETSVFYPTFCDYSGSL